MLKPRSFISGSSSPCPWAGRSLLPWFTRSSLPWTERGEASRRFQDMLKDFKAVFSTS